MTPAELKEQALKLYPATSWQSDLARALKVNSRTVRRWYAGDANVPGPVAAALLCFVRERGSKESG